MPARGKKVIDNVIILGCNGLLRPAVIWFGERLEESVMEKADEELDKCDLCLVIGTSSIVYPAAMFAPQVSMHFILVYRN